MHSFYPLQLNNGLTLKPLATTNPERFLSFLQNNPHLKTYDAFMAEFQNLSDIEHFLAAILKLYQDNKSLTCGIWDQDMLIGYVFCGLDHTNRTIDLGYGLDKNYIGQGIIKNVAKILLDHAFKTYDINYALLTCWTTNQRSIHTAESLGFKREATLIPADQAKGIPKQYRYILPKPSTS